MSHSHILRQLAWAACAICVIGAAIGPAVAEDGPFEWPPRHKAEPPGNDCSRIPYAEKRKFGNCGIKIELDRQNEDERKRKEARKAAADAARVAWVWLDARPQADCGALPEQELRKFFCEDPDEDAQIEIAAELEGLINSRAALAAQIRSIEDRKSRLALKAAELADDDLHARLDAIQRLEAAVGRKAAERDLLRRLAEDAALLRNVDAPPRAMRLATARAAAAVYRSPDRAARPVGKLRAGEMVVVLDETAPGPFKAVVRAAGDVVYTRDDVLE